VSSKRAKPVVTTRQEPELTPDDLNANLGTKRGLELLEKSLERYGAGRAILVDKHGKIIAGNKTWAAAKEKGFKTRTVRVDGTELVVVQRTDLDMDADPRARELGIADNRVAEVDLEWDPEALASLAGQGIALGDWWFPDELSRVLDEKPSTEPQLAAGLEYRVVVDCADEAQQRDLIARFESEGLKCRPLIS
jgi:hypothetical protein